MKFELNTSVIYRGNSYSFPGQIIMKDEDDRVVVKAYGSPIGHYKNMCHIYSQKVLEPYNPDDLGPTLEINELRRKVREHANAGRTTFSIAGIKQLLDLLDMVYPNNA